jgi:hypothetical protein
LPVINPAISPQPTGEKMTELANLTDHRIEGIARMGNKPFSVPLFSHVRGNLWQGGCPVGAAPEQIKYIVSLYPWGQYHVHDHQIYLEATLFDSEDIPDIDTLDFLSDYIDRCWQRGPTLVHCQAGLNRSALVVAYTLIKHGMAPMDAISFLRERRSEAVLCNLSFETWLMGLGR